MDNGKEKEVMDNKGKQLPNSLEAERALLGAVISNTSKLYEVMEILSPKDFYYKRHKDIYKNILEMHKADIPIDSVTLGDYINKKGELTKVGGISYIVELENNSMRSINVIYYGRIIKDAYKLRTLLEVSEDIRNLAYDNSDAEDIINKACDKLYSLNFTKNSMKHISESLIDAMEKIEENYKRGGDVVGIKTKFLNLDRTIGGMQKGNLFIVAARPSMGKTTFGLNVLEEVSKDYKTAIFSFEMSDIQLMERMLSSDCKISMPKIKNAVLKEEEFITLTEGANRLSNRNIMIHDFSTISVSEIKAKCKKIKMDGGLDVVMIDYLQLIKGDERFSREQQVSKISRELKSMARELNICVLALAQLSRGPETRGDKRPLLSDLRESGAIEQDADIITFLYRDDYYDRESKDAGICEVIIAKNRNGQVGTIKLRWDGVHQSFSNFI